MKQNEFIIEELKRCLTLQLEAYHNNDQDQYNELEEQILGLEKRL
jgi:hypothetical protein